VEGFEILQVEPFLETKKGDYMGLSYTSQHEYYNTGRHEFRIFNATMISWNVTRVLVSAHVACFHRIIRMWAGE